MQMKSLTIQGFKSFSKETEILFPGGTSAIVGPNGCGKSNVVDAIRWALGEQSPKRLRGRTMEEILFNGSEHFPAANSARVALMLGRRDRPFPHPYAAYDELCVERLYYRSGESEYRINRMPVRLRDIVDLFMDTGTGTRAYSIIQQGYIAEIINAGPDQRRLFIEEAAGIVKYKKRKESAVRKMEATQENLRHIEAILSEIQRQMNALNRQAQKARRYHRLKGEIRTLECTLGSRAFAALRETEREEEARRARSEDRMAALVASLGREESGIEQIRAGLIRQTREAEERQAKLLESIQQLSSLESRQVYLRQTREDLERKTVEGRKQVASTRQELLKAEGEGQAVDARREELDRRSAWLREALREERSRFETIAGEEERLRETIEATKERLFSCMTRKAELHNRQIVIREKRGDLEQRNVRGGQEIEVLRAENESFLGRKGQLEEALEGRRRRRGLLLLERTALEANTRALKESFEGVSREMESLQTLLNRKRSRLHSLREFQESYEGCQEGVRAIMQRRRERADLQPGIQCMVADVIDTDTEHEMALECVLGERLQYMIVEDQQDGLGAIEYLKRETRGRGSFIPVHLRGEWGAPAATTAHPGTSMLEVVQVKEGYDEVAEYLLGDVILVPDLAEGLHLWRSNGHGCRIVTKEGELIDHHGVVSGGRSSGSGRTVLKTKREIRELQAEVEVAADEFEGSRRRSEAILRKVRFNEAELERVERDLYQTDMEILKDEKDVQQAVDQLDRNRRRLDVLETETVQFRREMEEWSGKEAACADEEDGLAGVQTAEERALARLNEEIRDWTAEKEISRDAVGELEVELQLIREKQAGLEAHRKQIDHKIRTVESFLGLKERECDEADGRMASLAEEILTHEASIRRVGETKRELEGILSEANQQIDRQKEELQKKEERAKALRGELDELRVEKDEVRLRLAELQLKKKNIRDQIWEKHRVDLDSGDLPELAEGEDAEVRERLEKLRVALERIGEVNPSAIEEFEELQKRHAFYVEQSEDLQHSLDSLRRLIRRIRRITKSRFLEAFEGIDARFKQVFPQLFGGGRAFLQLDGDKDPLESGVDIVAQPPGKKLQNINLLSGGEKSMAALALILAMFQYKPSPFCVLDEVDAALDDVNVFRFNEIVKEISSEAQFIMITHNKQTMEIADTLYGVTMGSPGVSQIVSVQM